VIGEDTSGEATGAARPEANLRIEVKPSVMIAAAGLSAASCASLGGDTQIVTEPPGAQVKLATGESCLTPCALPFARDGVTELTITKVGFKTKALRYRTSTLRPPPRVARIELELTAPTIPVEERPLSAPSR